MLVGNATPYTPQTGDECYVYCVDNNISTSFIIYIRGRSAKDLEHFVEEQIAAALADLDLPIASTSGAPVKDTWRDIFINGTLWKNTSTSSGRINLIPGANVHFSQSGNDLTISADSGSASYSAGDGLALNGTTFSVSLATDSGLGFDSSSPKKLQLADAYGDTKNPYGAKAATYVLAGPASGNAAAPAFRQLTNSDISGLGPLAPITPAGDGGFLFYDPEDEIAPYSWEIPRDDNTTYTLSIPTTGEHANQIGLVAGGSGSGTDWYTTPWYTKPSTGIPASDIAGGSAGTVLYSTSGGTTWAQLTGNDILNLATWIENQGFIKTDTNTWRPIKYGSTTLSDSTTTLEFLAGSNVGLAFAGGQLTISATDTTYSAGNGLSLNGTTFSVKTIQGSGIIVDANGVSVENPIPGHTAEDGTYLIWSGSATAWGNLPTGSTSQAGILQLGTTSTTAALGNHTHAWNSLTRSSTTAGQAIISTNVANGWALMTLGDLAYKSAGSGDINKFLLYNSEGEYEWANPIPTNNVTGSGTTNYLAKWTGTNTIGDSIAYANDNQFTVDAQDGTTTAIGQTYLTIGNAIAQGSANNSRGNLILYGYGSGNVRIMYNSNASGQNVWYIPPASAYQYFVSVDTGASPGTAVTVNTLPYFDSAAGHLVSSFAYKSTSGIQIDSKEGTTTTSGNSVVSIGNSTPSGTNGNTVGRLELYGWGSGKTTITYNCSDATSTPYYINQRGDRNQYFVSVDTGGGTNPSPPTSGAIPKFDGSGGHLLNSEIAGTSLTSESDITSGTNYLAFFDSSKVLKKTTAVYVKSWLGLDDLAYAKLTTSGSGLTLSQNRLSVTNPLPVGTSSDDGKFLCWDDDAGEAWWAVPSVEYASKLGNSSYYMVAENSNELNFYTSGSFTNGRIQIGGSPRTGRTAPTDYLFGNPTNITGYGNMYYGSSNIHAHTGCFEDVRFYANGGMISLASWYMSCLIQGTKITMADRTEKNIEEIVPGDEVLSYDPATNEFVPAVVLTADCTGNDCQYTTHLFDNGSYIVVYGEHSVYNKTLDRPIDIAKFNIGDKTYDADGNLIEYAGSMPYYTGEVRANRYDLNVSGNLYFANGILNGKNVFAKHRALSSRGIVLPQALSEVLAEQKRINAETVGYKTDAGYLAAISRKFKERSTVYKTIERAKKYLADSDYLVQKFTEGLLSTIEWLRAKTDRAEWRRTINDNETVLLRLDNELREIKARFQINSTPAARRFSVCNSLDVAHLEDYRAMFQTQQR